jgi:hypothetical protein
VSCPPALFIRHHRVAFALRSGRSRGLSGAAPRPRPQPPRAEAGKAAEAATSDWLPLFNGRDLEGWRQQGSARWRVEDGVIVGGQEGDPGRSGLLSTVEQFQDFELELEFMIDEHGKYNSGVYLRNDPKERGRTGYQVNIGRGAAEEYCAGLFTDRWLAKGDEHDTIRRKLAWNQLRILARGGHIEVTLNAPKSWTTPTPRPRTATPAPAFSPCKPTAPKATAAG